jgi:arylsulfatase A-like enzyme
MKAYPLRALPGLLAVTLALGCNWTHKPAGPGLVDAGYRCRGCNVLLISIDTLRADHLGVYGYPRPVSPNIDRFAREAVVFDRNINTGGGTLPVHASMFTSLPPTVHGEWADSPHALSPQRITLAEQLHDAGYHTRGYTGGGFVRAMYGLGKGFDSFYDWGGDFAVELPMLYQWIDSYHGGKFFLFLHTYDVHSTFKRLPYDHGPAYNRMFTAGYHGTFDGCRNGLCASELLLAVDKMPKAVRKDVFSAADVEYMKGLYDGGIAYVDDQLEQLFHHLRVLGLWDTTLIVLTADHGEEFAEHGRFLHEQNYEEIAHVPLMIRFPHGVFGGRRISELVSTLEIMPTVLDALGIPCNPEAEGRSLLPLLTAGREGRGWVYMAGAREKLRTPLWSLLVADDRATELYNVSRDPGETQNRLRDRPQLAAALLARYMQARAHDQEAHRLLAGLRPDPLVQPSPEDLARLRSLGYAK